MNRADLPNLDYICRTGDPTPGTRFDPKVLAEELQELIDYADAAVRRASYMAQQLQGVIDQNRSLEEKIQKLSASCPHCGPDDSLRWFYP